MNDINSSMSYKTIHSYNNINNVDQVTKNEKIDKTIKQEASNKNTDVIDELKRFESRSDSYTPQLVLVSVQVDPTKVQNQVNDMYANFNQAILSNTVTGKFLGQNINVSLEQILAGVMQIRLQLSDTMSSVINQTLDLFELTNKLLSDLGKAKVEFMKKQQAEAEKEAAAAAKKKGFFAILFGLFEAIVGAITVAFSIATMVASGGVGVAAVASAAVGIMMMINGFTKLAGGIESVVNPEKAATDSGIANRMSNGMFAIFGKDAQLASQIFAVVSAVAGGVSSAASIASGVASAVTKAVLISVVHLANTAVTLFGTVASFIYKLAAGDEAIDEQSDTSKAFQALSMGIAGAIVFGILESKVVKDYLKKTLGEKAAMIINMALTFAVSIVSSIALSKSASSKEYREAMDKGMQNILKSKLVKNSPYLAKIANEVFNSMKGNTTISKNKFIQTLSEMINAGVLIGTLNKISGGSEGVINGESGMNMAEIDVLTIMRNALDTSFKKMYESNKDNNQKMVQVLSDDLNQLNESINGVFDTTVDSILSSMNTGRY